MNNMVLSGGQALNITSGIIDQGSAFDLQTSALLTIGANGALNNLGTGDLLLGGNLTNSGTVRLNGNGAACGQPDAIMILLDDWRCPAFLGRDGAILAQGC